MGDRDKSRIGKHRQNRCLPARGIEAETAASMPWQFGEPNCTCTRATVHGRYLYFNRLYSFISLRNRSPSSARGTRICSMLSRKRKVTVPSSLDW